VPWEDVSTKRRKRKRRRRRRRRKSLDDTSFDWESTRRYLGLFSVLSDDCQGKAVEVRRTLDVLST
jgi:hypothetical protein